MEHLYSLAGQTYSEAGISCLVRDIFVYGAG
jgi:hypothetical protein